MEDKDLIKLSVKELVDMGVCPTCLNRRTNGGVYGDDKDKLLYQDNDIEIVYVSNPRAIGHLAIIAKNHYQDMSEAPDELNIKIIKYAKMLMNALKDVYSCVRVYLCTMCDGPMNHYHVQLIPRYENEERGSKNFVKPRMEYSYDEAKFKALQAIINEYAGI